MTRLSETQIQRAVFAHLRARGAPGVFAFHVPNGGHRRPVEAAILKGLGVTAGVPDIIAIHNGRCFALELKAEGARATDRQLAAIAALREAGALTAVAEGLDRALAVLEGWGCLRRAPLTARAPRLEQELAAAPTREEAQLVLDFTGADKLDESAAEQIQDIVNEK
jgi:hypothetical protein